jgi:tetratricopeptide (TPR) repeat protein
MMRGGQILAQTEGDVAATAFTESMLAVLEAMLGRFDDARNRWWRSKRRLTDLGLTVTVAVVQMYYAYIELLADSAATAEPEVTEACSVFERIGTHGHLSSAAGLAARENYAIGNYDEADRYRQLSEESAAGDDVVSQVLWRGTQAKLLANAGDPTRAEELAHQAVAMADTTDFLMMRGDALTDRAEVLASLGRHDAAARDLEQAVALYERKGIRPSANAPRRASRMLFSHSHRPA